MLDQMKNTNKAIKRFPLLESSFRWALYSGIVFLTLWAVTSVYADFRAGHADYASAFVRMWEFRTASNFLLSQALDPPGYFVNEYTIFVAGATLLL